MVWARIQTGGAAASPQQPHQQQPASPAAAPLATSASSVWAQIMAVSANCLTANSVFPCCFKHGVWHCVLHRVLHPHQRSACPAQRQS